ncbi:MAG: hypothetical protein KIT44_09415 [Opitutaceae bacterium]|nr:hypothetical protein [Opitutaceae bacterium]
MPLYRLLHALATGAATFTLLPTVPVVNTPVRPKSAADALAGDAVKLKGDFNVALDKLQLQLGAPDGGKSIQTEA